MAFQLIPMPISILFAVVFFVAITFALWKLRRKGKIYGVMFKVVAVFGVAILAVLVVMAIFQVPVAPGKVEISLTTNKSTYVLGEGVVIKFDVNNMNDWAVPGPTNIVCVVVRDNVHVGFFNIQNSYSTYAPNSVVTYQFEHQNYFTTPGNYTIGVTLEGDVNYSPTKEVKITTYPA